MIYSQKQTINISIRPFRHAVFDCEQTGVMSAGVMWTQQ